METVLSHSRSGGWLPHSSLDASWLHLGPAQWGESSKLPSADFIALCLHGTLLVFISGTNDTALGQPLASCLLPVCITFSFVFRSEHQSWPCEA